MSSSPGKDERDWFRATHERWLDRRLRKQEEPDYRDEWWGAQCGACRYWVPLSGIFGDDYGGCTNPNSPRDGCVQFEHDGCDEFAPQDESAP